MGHSLVIDKRVAGIIRWLERLKQSYSSGAMEVALMEAECARADLEVLRADVFGKIEANEFHEHKVFSQVWNFSKSLILAVIIVMVAVFPISKEIKSPLLTVEREEKNLNIMAEPIIIVREYEQQKTEISDSPVKTPAKNTKRSTHQPTPKIASVKNEPKEKVAKVKEEKKIPYEEVFSLMQTGQRALKNKSTVIEVK